MRKPRKYSKKVSVFWPVFIVIVGFLLIAGGFWLYDVFSKKEKIEFSKAGVKGEKTTREVNLYFASSDADKLAVEKREILKQSNQIEEMKMVVDELIRGPRNKNMTQTLPPQTKLRSLFVDFNEAVAYLDFTESLVEYSAGGSTGEILSVYSLSNTIIDNFPEVKQIKILISGEEKQTLDGHIDLTRPIGFSEGIVETR